MKGSLYGTLVCAMGLGGTLTVTILSICERDMETFLVGLTGVAICVLTLGWRLGWL